MPFAGVQFALPMVEECRHGALADTGSHAGTGVGEGDGWGGVVGEDVPEAVGVDRWKEEDHLMMMRSSAGSDVVAVVEEEGELEGLLQVVLVDVADGRISMAADDMSESDDTGDGVVTAAEAADAEAAGKKK